GFRDVNDTVPIDRHTLSPAGLALSDWIRVGNKEADSAITFVPDAKATLHHRVHFGRVRLRVGAVERARRVDENAARPAELLPFREESALLIEFLDAIVAAIGDEQPSLRVHREAVWRVELSGARSLLAPCFDERSVLVELDDAGVGVASVAVGHEDIAVGFDQPN